MSISIYDIALKINTDIKQRYTIKEYLSFGNTTIMYMAEDKKSNKSVLIKELCPFRLINRDMDGKNIIVKSKDFEERFEKIRQSFVNETQIIERLSDKKSKVRGRVPFYIDDFTENNTLYLVMEYYEGFDLRQRIAAGESLNFRNITYELADIVQKVHKAGILHRDIKLSNIFIKENGRVVLLDFGSACRVEEEKEAMKYTSSGYSAPEMYQEDNSTLYADIYSIGVVMYEMLTGVLIEKAALGVRRNIRDITEYVNVPWPLAEWIMRALELNPEKRIKNLSILKFLLQPDFRYLYKLLR